MQQNISWPKSDAATLSVQLQLPYQWPGAAPPFLWITLSPFANAPNELDFVQREYCTAELQPD